MSSDHAQANWPLLWRAGQQLAKYQAEYQGIQGQMDRQHRMQALNDAMGQPGALLMPPSEVGWEVNQQRTMSPSSQNREGSYLLPLLGLLPKHYSCEASDSAAGVRACVCVCVQVQEPCMPPPRPTPGSQCTCVGPPHPTAPASAFPGYSLTDCPSAPCIALSGTTETPGDRRITHQALLTLLTQKIMRCNKTAITALSH